MTGPETDARPLRISWTRLRAHGECPAKAQLIAEGRKAKTTDIRNFFNGTVVDSAMRQWLAQDTPEPGWMPARIDRILDEEEDKAAASGDGIVRWRNADDKAECRQFCRTAAVRLERLLTVLALPYEWQPAVRFRAPLTVPYLDGSPRQVLLTGETDLLVRRPDGLYILDLKVTKDPSYWRKTVAQLTFYEIAMKVLHGEWAAGSALVQPMCPQQVMPFRFGPGARRDMALRIHQLATAVWRDATPPKADAAGCSWCPVRHACPKYKVPGGHGRAPLPVTPTGGLT